MLRKAKFDENSIYTATDNIELIESEGFMLQDLRPEGSLYLLRYSESINELWSQEAITPTETNGTVDGSDYFVMDDDALNSYSFPVNSDKITIRGIFRFDYDTVPSTDRMLFTTTGDYAGNPANSIRLTHLTTGNLRLEVFTTLVDLISEHEVLFEPISFSDYDIEINIDLTKSSGEIMTMIFVDGIKLISGVSEVGERLTDANMLPVEDFIIGGDKDGANLIHEFSVAEITVFEDIINTISFDIYDVPNYLYSIEPERLIFDDYMSSEYMESFYSKTFENNTIRASFQFYNILTDTWDEKYWDSVTEKWQLVTDITDITQTTDFDDLNTVRLYHFYHEPVKTKLVVWMVSPDGFERPIFTQATINYNFKLIDYPEIHYTLVHGLIRGAIEKKKDYRVTAKLNKRTVYGGKIEMYPETSETATDDNMYWELLLPTTEDMESETYYQITLSAENQPSKTVNVTIPKVEVIEFIDLTTNYSTI